MILLKNTAEYKLFYFFVFDYLKDTKKVLAIEEALAAWGIVFKDKKMGTLGRICEIFK